jgi:shikimate kinase
MAPKAVLIGLPGSGKSTIGRRLAKAMGCALIDTDAVIEERSGRTIAEIFAAEGESGFRRIEEQVICEALDTHDGILSLGGGAVTTAGVREALAGHTVVYLEISGSTPIGEIPGRWFAISLADLRIRSLRDGGGHRGDGPPPALLHRR